MPYIEKKYRDHFNSDVIGRRISTAGELNYAITNMVHAFLGENANYQKYNDAMGALEGAKLELYRRKVAPYEDIKIEQNGDV